MNIKSLSNANFNAFSEVLYISQNRDIAVAVKTGIFSNAYEHFVNFGHIENRSFSPFFDGEYYLQKNADVAQVVATGATTAYAHFLQYGQSEGRAAFQGYNETGYLSTNGDVANAVEAGIFKSGWDHYTKFGITEGRSGFVARDIQFGNSVANSLTAKEGQLVFGGGGNDFINASNIVTKPNALSKLYGNEGADSFVFNGTNTAQIAPTVIGDFDKLAGDKIFVNVGGFDDFADIQRNAYSDGAGNTVILGTRVVIEAVTELDASMFEFI
jgi:hypothetical protein